MYIRKRIEKRFRRLADESGITYAEVNKIFRSQFLFAREKIESFTEEEMANASEEQLDKLVFNFLYIGKIYASKRQQGKANRKHKLNKERDESKK